MSQKTKEFLEKCRSLFLVRDDEKNTSMAGFKTVNGNTVIYQEPIEFFSVEDGHTDAYQMYLYDNDENTYFAFKNKCNI